VDREICYFSSANGSISPIQYIKERGKIWTLICCITKYMNVMLSLTITLNGQVPSEKNMKLFHRTPFINIPTPDCHAANA
jgi:hypothetical protein